MKIKNNKPRKKINTSKFNKKNIFVKQKWILLVFVTDIIILVLGLVDNKPFDLGSYVVSVALVNLFMFYFILAKIQSDEQLSDDNNNADK